MQVWGELNGIEGPRLVPMTDMLTLKTAYDADEIGKFSIGPYQPMSLPAVSRDYANIQICRLGSTVAPKREHELQSVLPHHRGALSERGHHGIHAVPDVGPVQGFSGAALRRFRTAAARCRTTGAAFAVSRRSSRSRCLTDHLLHNVFFDTCVYHQPGIDLLTRVIPVDNILFASEMIGAVRGIDPETGHYFDDTRRYIDASRIEPAQRRTDLRRQRATRLSCASTPH